MVIATHENVLRQAPERVFFRGTGALAKGTGVVLIPDAVTTDTGQTATDDWGKRSKIVDVPTKGYELHFYGVTIHDYAANAKGQWIEVLRPGSVAKVYVNGAVTIGDVVCCIVGGTDVGQFMKSPVTTIGIGCAVVMQTLTGEGMALAQLVNWGPQSGLVEVVQLKATGGAHTFTKNGMTHLLAQTLSANATYTLENGTFVGQRKGFFCSGAQTTNDLLVTVTSGIQADDSTAMVSFSVDDANELIIVEWVGDKWKILHKTGATVAAPSG
ncbi:MAG TPA: hypothetical protein PLX83_19250 [bacterium]|nr:hypothetical protein [bacterium]